MSMRHDGAVTNAARTLERLYNMRIMCMYKKKPPYKPTDARGSPVARLLSGVHDGRAVAVTLVYVACTLEGALGIGRDGLRLHARRIRNHRATDGERQGAAARERDAHAGEGGEGGRGPRGLPAERGGGPTGRNAARAAGAAPEPQLQRSRRPRRRSRGCASHGGTAHRAGSRSASSARARGGGQVAPRRYRGAWLARSPRGPGS